MEFLDVNIMYVLTRYLDYIQIDSYIKGIIW